MSTDEEIREVYEGDIARRNRVIVSRRDGLLEFYKGVESLGIDTVLPRDGELTEIGEMARRAEIES